MPATFLAPLLGVLVGLVLALTGAGGAILSIPLLVFGLHLSLAQAGPVALLAVSLAATLGAVLGWRASVLRYKAAGLMALAGAITSPVGLWLAHRIPNAPLTSVFAVVLAIVGWRMLGQASRDLRGETRVVAKSPPCRLNPTLGRLQWNAPCARALAIAGASAGFLSGLLGVGGGFIVVPTLLAVSDLPMKAVIATSMGVLALISAVGVFNAGVAGYMAWNVAWPFAAGALAGLLAGRRFAEHLPGARLRQGFALLSLGIACGLLARVAV